MNKLSKVIIPLLVVGLVGYAMQGAYFGAPVDPKEFKRVWDSRFVYLHPKSFVKPSHIEVKKAYNEAVQHQLFGSQAEKVRDWISKNIKYVPDYEAYNWYDCLTRNGDFHEYWQYPEETLAKRTGDCEDMAILMTSMLRAGGVPADKVYVALGSDGENNHAWVIVDDKPYEPIAKDPLQRIHGQRMLSKFDTYYLFNDENFYKL
jgi:transglutaminase-like putative cysteine protease